jgi:hypothetical protein
VVCTPPLHHEFAGHTLHTRSVVAEHSVDAYVPLLLHTVHGTHAPVPESTKKPELVGHAHAAADVLPAAETKLLPHAYCAPFAHQLFAGHSAHTVFALAEQAETV